MRSRPKDLPEPETMTLAEFRKTYMSSSKYFEFEKFIIICVKCGSGNVEFGGRTQQDSSGCYYEGDIPSYYVNLVCKCHACGNAFKMQVSGIDDY